MTDPDGRERFLDLIEGEIDRRVASTEVVMLKAFTREVMGAIDFEDIRDRQPNEVFAAIDHAWRYLQHYDHAGPKLSVFNPSGEEHGWTSRHTVVLVLTEGVPFVSESLRMELNRRNIMIHVLVSSDLTIERDRNHCLQRMFPATVAPGGKRRRREALVYMEVSYTGEQVARAQLAQALGDVIADVDCVAADAAAIHERVNGLADRLAQCSTSIPAQDWQENRALLHWLQASNFTFLGCEIVDVAWEGESPRVEARAGSQLGLLRGRPTPGAGLLAQDLAQCASPATLRRPQVLFFKSTQRSRVHRLAYPDYVAITCHDATGRIVEQHNFLGLFAATVYTMDPEEIPIVRHKVAKVVAASRPKTSSYRARMLRRILELLPRDELFQSDEERLLQMALRIFHIQERRKVRLFVRIGPRRRFAFCLVYMPRDIYCTEVRQRVEALLMRELGAEASEFSTFFSESVLVSTYFVMRLGAEAPEAPDVEGLESLVVRACEQWLDRFRQALLGEFGEELGSRYVRQWGQSFPAAYREDFDASAAVADIAEFESLGGDATPRVRLYRFAHDAESTIRFRLFRLDRAMVLSDVIPMLENFGMRVLGERPYRLVRADGREFWLHDFLLSHALADAIDIAAVAPRVQDGFIAVYLGRAENDAFNRLVIDTGLEWREIAVLRAYAHYMKQARYSFTPQFVSEALGRYPDIARALIELFRARFDPQIDAPQRAQTEVTLGTQLVATLEGVERLNDDHALRACLELIRATLRTNWFRHGADGTVGEHFAFKLDCARIAQLPRPVPMYEIWVYSPRVEGVHLRYGRVARGGLRWSDRPEDFRTEVLGLVKAQQTKNAVIVPVGAKGGFVPRRLHSEAGRDALQAEGIACYEIFIAGMLDLTDNIVDGATVRPSEVVCHDAPDPYLVVAADKGTAAFSDIANALSTRYGFWLHDAFASGGSVGYSHKKLGITARGAWVAVQRHFRELGVDVQHDPVRVIGIGDMSGDVFGNGMLRSRSIRLVAAFDHRHVFIDPEPDPEAAFGERERLFALPRSSWADYDPALISVGGGVFERSLKSIELSEQLRRLIDSDVARLTPGELISALLSAPVDLIFNGGIGTWFKASDEEHAAVGDKANDAVRVDASRIRARVIGEGGNLGMTQRARVEFATAGGACNTDFIDNSGGVDCSDHEVNIKILLNHLVASGEMTMQQRAQLLEDMGGEVADLVLANNYRQTQAISIAAHEAPVRINEHRELISSLEAVGALDRRLEFLPDDDALRERRAHGRGLTRPELAVLLSYVKARLKREIVDSALPEDPYVARSIERAFPPRLIERFGERLGQHQLRRELIATELANEIVDLMGITFIERLQQSTNASAAVIARAFVVARDVFALRRWWREVEALDHAVDAQVQLEVFSDLQRLVRLATRWFIHNRRGASDIEVEVAALAGPVAQVQAAIGEHARGEQLLAWRGRHDELLAAGLPETLARAFASSTMLIAALGIVDVALAQKLDVERTAQLALALNDHLDFYWFGKQITALAVDDRWQALARESYLDELDWQLRAIVTVVMREAAPGQGVEDCIAHWESSREAVVSHWRSLVSQIRDARTQEYAMHAVAVRALLALAQPQAG